MCMPKSLFWYLDDRGHAHALHLKDRKDATDVHVSLPTISKPLRKGGEIFEPVTAPSWTSASSGVIEPRSMLPLPIGSRLPI